jgi:phosphate transport system permease protein
MMVALVAVLGRAAVPSIKEFGGRFLVSTEWRPNEIERPVRTPDGKLVIKDGETVMETIPPAFGAAPVMYGTIVSSVVALVVAIPLSLAAALVLVRVAPRFKIAAPVSFLIEFLAAIPSIAYGIWGLFVLAPFLQGGFESKIGAFLGGLPGLSWLTHVSVHVGNADVDRAVTFTGRDMLCGGVVLGIMIVPIVTAVARDVLAAVPRQQIEGSLALGATWWESCKEMLHYGRSGLFGAVMLGLARAAGETMAVTMVIGNNNQIAPSPFAPAQTMSSLLANEFAEASTDIHRAALLEVALILLLMSLVFNVVARKLVVGGGARSAAAH